MRRPGVAFRLEKRNADRSPIETIYEGRNKLSNRDTALVEGDTPGGNP